MNITTIAFDDAKAPVKSFGIGNDSAMDFLFQGTENELLCKVASLDTRCESDLANHRYAQLDFELSELMRCYRERLDNPESALVAFNTYRHAVSHAKENMVLSELEASKARAALNRRTYACETPTNAVRRCIAKAS